MEKRKPIGVYTFITYKCKYYFIIFNYVLLYLILKIATWSYKYKLNFINIDIA